MKVGIKTLAGGITAVSMAAALALPGAASGAGRHQVRTDVDRGGGVLLANVRGGYYMGRLFPTWTFDRHGGWYRSRENRSSYAWGFAWGHSNACLWIGPSRGKRGWTASEWATPVKPGYRDRCDGAQQSFLRGDNGTTPNIASHSNCPPHTATHGTRKALLKETPAYWNINWGGDYDGGPLRDPVGTLAQGTEVWYRYTTRDGNAIVAFVPTLGWVFLPSGVVNRERTGHWSKPPTSREPEKPGTCPKP